MTWTLIAVAVGVGVFYLTVGRMVYRRNTAKFREQILAMLGPEEINARDLREALNDEINPPAFHMLLSEMAKEGLIQSRTAPHPKYPTQCSIRLVKKL